MHHTVLVLEDTPHLQEVIERLIHYRDPSAEIHFADTVEDAHVKFKSHEEICYVVVDLLMIQDYEPPGTQFIIDLLQEAQTAHQPILAISAWSAMVKPLIKVLKQYPQNQVTIVLRTDYEKFKAGMNEFIRRFRDLCSVAG